MEVVPRSGSSKTDANAGAPNGAARALSKQRGSTCSHVTCFELLHEVKLAACAS